MEKLARQFPSVGENKMNKFMYLLATVLMGFVGMASAVAPIDVTTVGDEVLPYITTAAGAGLLIFGALYAIRVIIKAFRAAGK